jgi:hypothetical protein
MKSGAPTKLKRIHTRQPFTAGRHKERLAKLLQKRERVLGLEDLLYTHENAKKTNQIYVKELRRKLHEARQQLAVMSTTEQMERT